MGKRTHVLIQVTTRNCIGPSIARQKGERNKKGNATVGNGGQGEYRREKFAGYFIDGKLTVGLGRKDDKPVKVSLTPEEALAHPAFQTISYGTGQKSKTCGRTVSFEVREYTGKAQV